MRVWNMKKELHVHVIKVNYGWLQLYLILAYKFIFFYYVLYKHFYKPSRRLAICTTINHQWVKITQPTTWVYMGVFFIRNKWFDMYWYVRKLWCVRKIFLIQNKTQICAKDIFLGIKRGFIIKLDHILFNFADIIPLGYFSPTRGSEG